MGEMRTGLDIFVTHRVTCFIVRIANDVDAN